jgi:hypothetical protein
MHLSDFYLKQNDRDEINMNSEDVDTDIGNDK